jgi:fucose 4-O-acetylase-like acetyltransferase
MASVEEFAAATPVTRDRVVDLLRGVSILAVIFGHWFIGVVSWQHGVIRTTSAIGVTPGLWLLTWVFQVMPIFFFVGGYANATAYVSSAARGESSVAFVRRRVTRLLRPSLVFVGVWAVIQLAMHLFDVGSPTAPALWGETTLLRGVRPPPQTVPFGPMWFLAFYLVVVTIAPLTVALHRRFGWKVIWIMVVGAVAADVAGFVVDSIWRWFNVVFVLLLPHQLGHFLADGSLDRVPRRVFWWMIGAGLAGLVLLTNPLLFEPFGAVRFEWFPGIGYYPKSLTGVDQELVSNAYPPTLCYLLGGVWTIGAAMLLRPRLAGWLERPRPWRFTLGVNATIMTLFLWHMTAFLLAVLALWPMGFGRAEGGTARWWLERPVWIVVPGLILAGLVVAFSRFERPRR